MTVKDISITFIPPLRKDDDGWLNIDGKIWQIINWHSFSDLGQTLETLTIERGNQVDSSKRMRTTVYSQDEGETFTFDI